LGWALKAAVVVRPVMAKRVATVVTDFMVLDIQIDLIYVMERNALDFDLNFSKCPPRAGF
jgi:hypothetical protein